MEIYERTDIRANRAQDSRAKLQARNRVGHFKKILLTSDRWGSLVDAGPAVLHRCRVKTSTEEEGTDDDACK